MEGDSQPAHDDVLAPSPYAGKIREAVSTLLGFVERNGWYMTIAAVVLYAYGPRVLALLTTKARHASLTALPAEAAAALEAARRRRVEDAQAALRVDAARVAEEKRAKELRAALEARGELEAADESRGGKRLGGGYSPLNNAGGRASRIQSSMRAQGRRKGG